MNGLNRALSLTQATAINVIDMVGIGPFIALSFVMSAMGGVHCMLAWLLGALLSFMDGFTWSALGAAHPEAGGTYAFNQQLYKRFGIGRLMAFLFLWQTTIQAPLVIASGAIGFSKYFQYLIPLDGIWQRLTSGALVIVVVVLLFRKVTTVGNISVLLSVVVFGLMGWLIISGLLYTQPLVQVAQLKQLFNINWNYDFFRSLNTASLKTIYCFLGYYNVCHLGGEIRNPQKNIPRSIFISIAIITVLYLLMQWSVLRVVGFEEAAKNEFVISLFFERIYNSTVAVFATCCILLVAFASLFAVVLGYSRIPYAAAVEGNYFRIFGKLHPTLNFPHYSLLILGAVAFCFSLFNRMGDIISAIVVVRILIQFVSQAAGLLYNRAADGSASIYKMLWFPIPSIISIAIWLYIFTFSEWKFIIGACSIIISGLVLYYIFINQNKNKGV